MRALISTLFTLLIGTGACGSPSTPATPDAPPGAADAPATDAPPASTGFAITIGSDYVSAAAVTFAAARTSAGVYKGYYVAKSAFSTTPNLSVSLHVPEGSVAATSYPCARSASSDSFDETGVTITWLDGKSYYTNLVPAPTCTITITALSPTSVSATISGTIYDVTDSPDHPASSFTASFTAMIKS